MTEKEKMIAGLRYDPSDPILDADRDRAKMQCYEFNQLHPMAVDHRTTVLKGLFATTGERLWIEPPFYCDYGYNIKMGERFYANHGLTILDTSPVIFGDDVLIGPRVTFSAATHPLSPRLRREGIEESQPITVGNTVWIGMGAQICPGVTIGDNAVIAAGAVVTRDVPANVVVAGVPAAVVKSIDGEG